MFIKSWMLGLVVAVAAMSVAPATAKAQADHLECYKFKDTLKSSAVINVVSQQFGTASGCKVKVKGSMVCKPALKTVTSTDAPVLTYTGQNLTEDRVCYKVKCPKVALPSRTVLDQFGMRTISKFSTSLVCTPASVN